MLYLFSQPEFTYKRPSDRRLLQTAWSYYPSNRFIVFEFKMLRFGTVKIFERN